MRCVFSPRCSTFSRDRSPTDSLEELQTKMQEYMNNGTRLGWLIDPQEQTTLIYRQGQKVQVLREAELSRRESPSSLSGEDVLPGFMLRLDPIWR